MLPCCRITYGTDGVWSNEACLQELLYTVNIQNGSESLSTSNFKSRRSSIRQPCNFNHRPSQTQHTKQPNPDSNEEFPS
jgi:hypothetical protein